MPSPICTVNTNPTTNGVNVTDASTVTIELVDTSANHWTLTCLGTDETNSADAVNTELAATINLIAKTATFTAGALGSAYIFKSVVGIEGPGLDANGLVVSSYTTTFGVYVLTGDGFRVGSAGETLEGNVSVGWVDTVNKIVRRGPSPPSGTAGGDLTGSYPNPLIGNSKVTTAKINNAAVTSAKLDPAIAVGGSLQGPLLTPDLSNFVKFPNDTNVSVVVKQNATPIATAQQGNDIAFYGQPAIAGTTTAGAANGGGFYFETGNADRLTSGNGASGDFTIHMGAPVGNGFSGVVNVYSRALSAVPGHEIMILRSDNGASRAATMFTSGIAANKFYPGQTGSATGPFITSGFGSPEGVVAAPVGSLYQRADGGAGTSLYVKQSGAGNIGWVGK